MQLEIQEKILSLIEKQKSLLLSTIDSNSEKQPFASYAPYSFDLKSQSFYVLLSDLARHSKHLIENPLASILIIEDEINSEQIFARMRVQYQIIASEILDEDKQQLVHQQMKYRLGDIVDVLMELPDFHLFELTPQKGRFIEGFGKAYSIQTGIVSGIKPAMLKKAG